MQNVARSASAARASLPSRSLAARTAAVEGGKIKNIQKIIKIKNGCQI
jgi:hypothetical protein